MMHYLFSHQRNIHTTREYREVNFAGETQNNQQEENEQHAESSAERQNEGRNINKDNVDKEVPDTTKRVIKRTGDRQQQNQNAVDNTNGSLRKMAPQRTPEQLQKIQEAKQRVADLKARKAKLQAMSPEQRAAFLRQEMEQKSEKRKQEMAAKTQSDDADVPNQVFMNVPPEPQPDPNNPPAAPNNNPPNQPPQNPNNQPPAGPDQSKLTQAERDQIIADAKADLGDLNALKKMKPEERDKKIAEVQAKHGVEVTEESGTYKVDVAENKSEVAMNKMMGQFMKLAIVLQRFKKMFDKMLGKNEEVKKEEEKTPEEKNKEKGLQAMKDSGLEFDPPNAFEDVDAAEYVVKKNGNQNVPHIKFENGKWMVRADGDVDWVDDLKYAETDASGNPDESALKWNALLRTLKTGNVDAQTAKTEKEKAEKEKAKVKSVPDGDVWQRLANDPADQNAYKKAKDGRVYKKEGSNVSVFEGDKWVNAATDAGISDPTNAATYNNILSNGGDQGWVRYGLTQHLYRIDLQNKSLYSTTTVGGNMQYQPGTNSWQYKAFPS